jgi:DNA-binding response OmpR family regulator
MHATVPGSCRTQATPILPLAMDREGSSGPWFHGRFAFDPVASQLTVGDRIDILDGRQAAILSALLEHFPSPVSKDELMARAWPGRLVHENSLAKGISRLRAAIEGSALEIATVYGLGYQLRRSSSNAAAAGSATEVGHEDDSKPDASTSNGLPSRASWAIASLGAAALAGGAYLAASRNTVPIRLAPPITSDPARAVGTILWVDDHPENNTLDAAFFRQHGIAVHMARSTAEAVKLVAINKYDLVISDLGRGDDRLAGTGLARRLRDGGERMPIIIYTLRSSDPVKQTAKRGLVADSGATGLATSPQDIRQQGLAAIRGQVET